MTFKWGFIAIMAVALSLAAASCGDSDDGGDTGATSAAAGETTEASESGGDEASGGNDGDGETSADSDSGEGDSASKAQFVKQANQICSQGRSALAVEITAELKGAQEGKGAVSEEGEAAQRAAELVAPNMELQIDQIEELDPPAGDEQQIEEFTDSWRQAIEDASQPLVGIYIQQALADTAKQAQEYGLFNCMYR